MTRWFKDPLFHFLLIGAGLFLLYGLLTDEAVEQPKQIVFSQSDIDRVINLWERKWQRLPAQHELQGLIERQIREEVLYREALAMGLDKGDHVVRRRMAQKMEFISNDLVSLADPEESQLQAYLDAHRDTFIFPGRVNFSHIYLNSDRRGEHTQADAKTLLQLLSQSSSLSPVADNNMAGDPFMGGYDFDNQAEYNVARLFGSAFAQQMFKLPVGEWTGPVESGYGLHLVRIDSRSDSKVPSLAQVRNKVRVEWLAEQRRKTNNALYDELRKRYEVIIESASIEPSPAASNG